MFGLFKSKKKNEPKEYNILQVEWSCIFTFRRVHEDKKDKLIIRRKVQITDYDRNGELYGFYYIDRNDLVKEKVKSPLTIHLTHLQIKGCLEYSTKEVTYNVERSALYTWNTEYSYSVKEVGKTTNPDLFIVMNPLEQ